MVVRCSFRLQRYIEKVSQRQMLENFFAKVKDFQRINFAIYII